MFVRQILAAALVTLSPVSTVEVKNDPWLSSNWAGYAFQGQFKGGSGTFIVPGAWGNSYAAQWFGIDGYDNTDLIQAGVMEACENSACQYQAWWEILPSASQPITWMKVSPGDSINVSINKTTGNLWNIQLTDVTSAQTFSQTFHYNGPATSAEWIDEAPEVGGSVVTPLPHSPVPWSDLHISGRAAILDDVWCVSKTPAAKNGKTLVLPQVVPTAVPNAAYLMAEGFETAYVDG